MQLGCGARRSPGGATAQPGGYSWMELGKTRDSTREQTKVRFRLSDRAAAEGPGRSQRSRRRGSAGLRSHRKSGRSGGYLDLALFSARLEAAGDRLPWFPEPRATACEAGSATHASGGEPSSPEPPPSCCCLCSR